MIYSAFTDRLKNPSYLLNLGSYLICPFDDEKAALILPIINIKKSAHISSRVIRLILPRACPRYCLTITMEYFCLPKKDLRFAPLHDISLFLKSIVNLKSIEMQSRRWLI